MALRLNGLIAAASATLLAFTGGAAAQEDDPFAPPTRAWEQGMIHKNTIPTEFETLILADTEEEQEIARKVVELYKIFETNPTDETLRPYISDRYIQHSSMLPNGRQPLAALFGGSAEQYPVAIDIHRIIVQDNFAFAHVNFRNLETSDPRDMGMAAVDMYLFGEDGRVAEHWDVLQFVPSHAPNPNGMFLQLYEGE